MNKQQMQYDIEETIEYSENNLEDITDMVNLFTYQINNYLDLICLCEENDKLIPIDPKIYKKMDKILKEFKILINHINRDEQRIQEKISHDLWLKFQGVEKN